MRRRIATLDDATLTNILPDYEEDSKSAIFIRDELARRGIPPDISAQGDSSATPASEAVVPSASTVSAGEATQGDTSMLDMLNAALTGNMEKAKRLLNDGLGVNDGIVLTDKSAGPDAYLETTALHMAATMSRIEVVQFLLANGADPLTRDGRGRIPLDVAENATIAAILKDAMAREKQAKKSHTERAVTSDSIHEAVGTGNMSTVQRLLLAGADVNASVGDGWRPLHVAADVGNVKMVTLLIQHGASLDSTRTGGFTPLFTAAQLGHLDIVRNLVKAGASIEHRTDDGGTAIFVATANGHVGVVEFLIASGANSDARSKKRGTPLGLAAELGNLDMARVLLAEKPDINAANIDGFTALHLAAQNGHREVIPLLIEHGADVNARTRAGKTPGDIARIHGHSELVASIVRRRTDPAKRASGNSIDNQTDVDVSQRYLRRGMMPTENCSYSTDPGHEFQFAGLTFNQKITVSVLRDGTLLVHEAGVVGRDQDGKNWRSQEVRLDGKDVFAFFVIADAAPSAQLKKDELAEFAKSEAYANADVGRKDRFNDYLNAGTQFFRSGKLEDALGMFNRVLEQDDLDELGIKRWTVLSNRALVYANMGRLRQAYEDISQSIELAETDPSAKGTTGLQQARRMRAQIKSEMGGR